jgi:hypothetical protein
MAPISADSSSASAMAPPSKEQAALQDCTIQAELWRRALGIFDGIHRLVDAGMPPAIE